MMTYSVSARHEEVLSDDHAGAPDNAGRTPEILAHVCESAWTSRYSSFACLPSAGKRQWAASKEASATSRYGRPGHLQSRR